MTTPEREKVRQKKLTCTQKTASRDFFSYPIKTSQENRSQSPELHQRNRLTTTKIASGIPYWPGRDPIDEEGGANLYAFVENDGLIRWDILGMRHPDDPGAPGYDPCRNASYDERQPGGTCFCHQQPHHHRCKKSKGGRLPNFTFQVGKTLRVGGCAQVGPFRVCLKGGYKVKAGPCCKADGSTAQMKSIKGTVKLSAGPGTGAGFSFDYAAPIPITTMKACPTETEPKVGGSLGVGGLAGVVGGECAYTFGKGWGCSTYATLMPGAAVYGFGELTFGSEWTEETSKE